MSSTGKDCPSTVSKSDDKSLEYSTQDLQIIVTPPKAQPPDPDEVDGWDQLSTQDLSNMNDVFNYAQLTIDTFDELSSEDFKLMEKGIEEIENGSKLEFSESILEEFERDFESQETKEKTETLTLPPPLVLMEVSREVSQKDLDSAHKGVLSQREGESEQVTIDEVLLLINGEDESSPVQCCSHAG